MRIASYQQSGVAWVPWRMQQALRMLDPPVEMDLFCGQASSLESYGLPGLQELQTLQNVKGLPAEYDVLMVHHDHLARTWGQDIHDQLRDRGLRIVTVVHGEPDRRLIVAGHRRGGCLPDLFIHVSRDTWRHYRRAFPETQSVWLPNHPVVGTSGVPMEHPVFQWADRPRTILVPWSAVSAYKSYGLLASITAEVESMGWSIERLRDRLPNEQLRRGLGEARACWVQFEGYAPDLLTQECWAAGCVPLVGAEDWFECLARFAYDFIPTPENVPDDSLILARLEEASGEREPDIVAAGRAAVAARTPADYARELLAALQPLAGVSGDSVAARSGRS